MDTDQHTPEKDRFTQACEDAISENQLVICAVTSGTQASFPSDAIPYGAGKSTLAFHLAYHLNHFDPVQKRYSDVAIDPDEEDAWATTKRNAWYYPSKILRGIDAASAEGKIINAGVWDDVQFTAPKKAGLPKALERLVGVLTTERPILRVLIMTFPSMDDISNVVARLIQFELIVNRRGYYEVQQIMKRKNYKNPRKDFIHLGYVSGLDPVGRPPDFDPLPAHMQTWYDHWREEQKRPSRKSAIKELERYENVMPREEQDKLTSSAASALAFKRWGDKSVKQG